MAVDTNAIFTKPPVSATQPVINMGILKFIQLITFLFLATCLFCWIFTSHWIFGPIVTLVSFLSGLLLIGLLGVAIINEE